MDVEAVFMIITWHPEVRKKLKGVHTLEKSYLAVDFATLTTAMLLAPSIIVR